MSGNLEWLHVAEKNIDFWLFLELKLYCGLPIVQQPLLFVLLLLCDELE